MASAPKKQRLNLLIPQSTKLLLGDLQERTHAAHMTEVIRRALSLYDFVTGQIEEGRELVVRDPEGKVDPTLIPRWW